MSTFWIPPTDTHPAERRKLRLLAVASAALATFAVWLLTSLAALVLSLGGPLSGDGVSSADRLALVWMHLAAAAVVIPLLYRSSPIRLSQADDRQAG